MKTRRGIVALVAERDLRDRLRRPSYYVITGLFVVLILGFGLGTRLIDQRSPGPVKAAVTGTDAAAFAETLDAVAEAADRTTEVHETPGVAGAQAVFDDGDADLVVDTNGPRLITTADIDESDVVIVQQAWTIQRLHANLTAAGLTDTEATEAATVPSLSASVRARPGDTSAAAAITGTLAAALLFISLQIFGGQILAGVVEEKSTGVIEVLLARLRADELLAGKVIGVGIAAMAQFTVLVAAGLVALAVSGTDLPGAIWSAVPMALLWYLGGFAFYAMAFALAGALVSRQEDAAAAATPITTALIGAYALLFVIGDSPGSVAATVLSLVPPFAPILMPLRMAAGAANVVEVVAALVLLAVGVVAMWKLTARVYAGILLRRGARVRWREVWRVARDRPT